MVDLDDLRALARSSPWLWRTAQLTVAWQPARAGGHAVAGAPVRAWVEPPQGLRVEDLATGRVLTAQWEPSPAGRRLVGGPSTGARGGMPLRYQDEGAQVEVPFMTVHDPGAPRPRRREDGLVLSRPARHGASGADLLYDGVLWQTYRWVTMLDPVELADGSRPAGDDGRQGRDDRRSPVRLAGAAGSPWGTVAVVDHHGRPAWQAYLAPTGDYDPRCSCCPLLTGEVAARDDAVERGGVPGDVVEPVGGWAAAHRVRLDRATGIVVELEQVGGRDAGEGWTAHVEAVDRAPRSRFTGT